MIYQELERNFNVTADQVESAYTIIDIMNRKWVPDKKDALSLIVVLIESRLSNNGSLVGYELKQFLGMIYECNKLEGLLIAAWDDKGDHKPILGILEYLMVAEGELEMKGKEKEFWRYLQQQCGSEFCKVYNNLSKGYLDVLNCKQLLEEGERT